MAFLEDLSTRALEIALKTVGPIAIEMDAEYSFKTYKSGLPLIRFTYANINTRI